jgi:hypothetical protein
VPDQTAAPATRKAPADHLPPKSTPPAPKEQQTGPQGIRVTLAGDTWEFSEDTADSSELVDLELATGWTTGEWQDAVNRGSMRGLVALVWLLRRRTEPDLPLNDVKFRVADLKVEFLTEETAGKAPSNGS